MGPVARLADSGIQIHSGATPRAVRSARGRVGTAEPHRGSAWTCQRHGAHAPDGARPATSEPEVAIRELTAALDEDPGLFMARRTRAVAYTAANRYDSAIADLRLLDKEGQLAPDDSVLLGDNLRFAGRLEEAALVLERAAQQNPTYPQPLLSLADVR